MSDQKITIDELAKFMAQHITLTYDVFEKHRHESSGYDAASWARGRVDAYLQIMAIIDKDREEMLRAEWERVVNGEGFMKDEG